MLASSGLQWSPYSVDERDINLWLEENYPTLSLRPMRHGGWGVWQSAPRYEHYEFEGETLTYRTDEMSVVFPIKNRIIGSWVCDEVMKRDPRLWHNEGNMFHDAFLNSKKIERAAETRRAAAQASGQRMWEACRRNDRLMGRVAQRMEQGDMVGAYQQFSLESLFMHAYKDNPKETMALVASNERPGSNVGF